MGLFNRWKSKKDDEISKHQTRDDGGGSGLGGRPSGVFAAAREVDEQRPVPPAVKWSRDSASGSGSEDAWLFEPPPELVCRLSGQLFEAPVLNAAQEAYERSALAAYLDRQPPGLPALDPATKRPLANRNVSAADALAARAADYRRDAATWCCDAAARTECEDRIKYLRRAAELAGNALRVKIPGLTATCVRYLSGSSQGKANDDEALQSFADGLREDGCGDKASNVYCHILRDKQEQLKKHQHLNATLEQRCKTLDEENSALKKENMLAANEKRTSDEKQESLKGQLENLQTETKKLKDDKEQLNQRLSDMEKLKNKLDGLEKENERLKQEAESTKQDLSNLERKPSTPSQQEEQRGEGTYVYADTLYVGNLPPTIDEDSLQKHFEAFGEINEIELILNASGQCRGHAFVRYSSEEAADKAIDESNGIPLGGKFEGRSLKVSKRTRGEEIPNAIYVGNLTPTIGEDDLNNEFQKFGRITDIEVKRDRRTGRCQGHAFITFTRSMYADFALEEMNGSVLDGKFDGRRIKVTKRQAPPKDRNPAPRHPSGESNEGNTIFVGNLPHSADEDLIRQKFENFGKIIEVQVIRDHETKNCRGYGFVTYSRPEHAKDAVDAMDGAPLGGKFEGRRLNVSMKKKTDTAKDTNNEDGSVSELTLHIDNLAPKVSEDDLRNNFQRFGQVEDVQVIRDRDTKKCRGYGFVTYRTKLHAQDALDEMNGTTLDGPFEGRSLKVAWKRISQRPRY